MPKMPTATETKLMPRVELEEAEGEARRAGVDVLADHAEQEAEHDHRERLEDRAVRQRDRGDRGRARSARNTRAAPKFSAARASGGAASARTKVATVPAKNEPSAAVASAGPAWPLRRHLVAVDGGDRRGRFAGEVDEDRRRRAAVLRAVVDAGEHDERGDRREGEGDRQQHRDRRGRADAGQHADEGAEQHADEAVEEVDRRRARSRSRGRGWRGGPCSAAEPGAEERHRDAEAVVEDQHAGERQRRGDDERGQRPVAGGWRARSERRRRRAPEPGRGRATVAPKKTSAREDQHGAAPRHRADRRVGGGGGDALDDDGDAEERRAAPASTSGK